MNAAANTIALTPLDLVLAASLLVINAAISWAFGLRLERGIAFAATRMVVQVALVGLVLKFIFAQTSPVWTLALVQSWRQRPESRW
jgi:putative ABC transport system permease protein